MGRKLPQHKLVLQTWQEHLNSFTSRTRGLSTRTPDHYKGGLYKPGGPQKALILPGDCRAEVAACLGRPLDLFRRGAHKSTHIIFHY